MRKVISVSEASFYCKGDSPLYILSGILNNKTVPNLWVKSQVILECDKRPLLVFDLKQVVQSDSSGIALLIAWMRMLYCRNQKINFIHFPKQMLTLVRITKLEKIIPINGDENLKGG